MLIQYIHTKYEIISYLKISGAQLEEVLDSSGLGLGEGPGTGVGLAAGLLARAHAAPAVAEVPVQVDADARAAPARVVAVLPPEPVAPERVLVPIKHIKVGHVIR